MPIVTNKALTENWIGIIENTNSQIQEIEKELEDQIKELCSGSITPDRKKKLKEEVDENIFDIEDLKKYVIMFKKKIIKLREE